MLIYLVEGCRILRDIYVYLIIRENCSVLIKKIRENTGYNVIRCCIMLLDIFPILLLLCVFISDVRFIELFTLSLPSDFWCRSF